MRNHAIVGELSNTHQYDQMSEAIMGAAQLERELKVQSCGMTLMLKDDEAIIERY